MDFFEVSRWQQLMASTIRAVVEPMLGMHFGWDAVDGLFRRTACCWTNTTATAISLTNIYNFSTC
ncbi:hypothetical protein E2562_029798 [Oryza meyeriana var. granulata]|uniref:Uncharacterized protein n=1 Tax=Oryza meyeriana var. granulata TaxID=110450 RepID=A0A6G1E579_9ORYZ|nr:hypothetical protein E2562_029798 [Oryza meyeriana var. granulata]